MMANSIIRPPYSSLFHSLGSIRGPIQKISLSRILVDFSFSVWLLVFGNPVIGPVLGLLLVQF